MLVVFCAEYDNFDAVSFPSILTQEHQLDATNSTPEIIPILIETLGQCRHCLVGTVALETRTRSIFQTGSALGDPPTIKKTQTCYCQNCATCFHVETYLRTHPHALDYTKTKPAA